MQDWSWVESGWVRSLFFVLFSYFSKAELRTDWKLEWVDVEVEVEGVERAWDIGLIHKRG